MIQGGDGDLSAHQSTTRSLRIGAWSVEPASNRLIGGDETVRVEPKAMEVLVYLASKAGNVVSREELESEVWRGAVVGYDAVTNTIIKLRKALGDSARNPKYIETVPKRGYRLIASVEAGKKAGRSAPHPISQPAHSEPQPAGSTGFRLALLAGILFAVTAVVAAIVVATRDDDQPTAVDQPQSRTIVVLPFENLSDDPDQEIFADGITEDIITDLSRLSNLQTIAGNTAFAYKGKRVQPQQVRAELQVDFVVDGSIRRLGNAIRINAQLVDAETGLQKWAERYDRPIAELFDIQDEVTAGIIEALAVRTSRREDQRLAQQTTANLRAYDLFLEGQRLSKIGSEETNRQAQATYLAAIELDPSYGRAYGALAYSKAVAFRHGWTDSPMEALDRAHELAKKAVSLDESIPQTHWALGYVYLMRKEYAKAEKAASRAIDVAPNYADGFGLLALISNNLGKPEDAIGFIQRGMQLNPYYTWDYPYNLGRAHYLQGRYEEAVASLEKAQARNENAAPIRLFLIASLMRAGREEDAEWAAEELQMAHPSETVSQVEKATPIQDPVLRATFLEDLRAAGIPD